MNNDMKEEAVIAWEKKNGELPPGRCTDSGLGLLVITSVEAQDSGTYVCTVTLGSFEVKKELELQVEGTSSGYFENMKNILCKPVLKLSQNKILYFKGNKTHSSKNGKNTNQLAWPLFHPSPTILFHTIQDHHILYCNFTYSAFLPHLIKYRVSQKKCPQDSLTNISGCKPARWLRHISFERWGV